VEGQKPQVGQARPQQPVQPCWRRGDPVQKSIQLILQPVSGRRFKVKAFPADGAGEHLHWSRIAQAIGTIGEQALVPLIQRGQGETTLQGAGGFQQHIQQALHLCAGGRLTLGQGEAQPAGDRGSNLGGIQQLTFNGRRAQALAAQQGRDHVAIERGLECLQPDQQLLASSARLPQRGIQNRTVPAEPGPVRLLPDPG